LERKVTLITGVCSANWAVTLARFVLNQVSSEDVVGRGGGGGIVVAFRLDSREAQSVSAQLGVGGGARNRGASKRRRIGTWSEPVDGRGSDHSVKYGAWSGHVTCVHVPVTVHRSGQCRISYV